MDSASGLGQILNSIMQDPELMKTISSIAGNMGDDRTDNKTDDEKAAEETTEGFTIPPELLSKLPQIMSSLSSKKAEEKNDEKGIENRRRALLSALKPFLSEKRRSLIDSLIQLEGLAGVLDAFKIK